MMVLRTVCWCLLYFLFLDCINCYHMTWGPIYNSFDHQYDDLQPQDVMVDYINRVGLYLLDVHNEDNLHNNIALSPYGAVSVLIALAEGLRGDAALEIYRASHIPHDLTIIRIGLRDIHRHLKSYFIPREGFLAGLTLSHENVTLTPSYERILRFYGYDLDSFHGVRVPASSSPSMVPPVIPEITTTTTREPEVRTEPRPTTEIPRRVTSEETVTIPVVEITTPQQSEEITTVADIEETTVPVIETTTLIKSPETTMKIAVEPTTIRTSAETTTLQEAPTTESASVFVAVTTESEAELITPISSTSSKTTTVGTTTTTGVAESTTVPTETKPEILEAVRTMSSANLALRKSSSNVTGKIEMITAINIQTETKIGADKPVDNTNTKRNQRSIIDYLIARYYDDYYIPKKFNFPNFRPRIPFFIDGIHRIDRAYFMTYDTVLPFFYMPNLEAAALSFPLDSTNYYLLLILPLREDGIDDLICDLKQNPDLKYIITNMKYTHVKAIIPSFTLRGYVNLTPSLQRLGIQKIFEPHHADFTPMTNNKDVYVTNIEQAITVKIRNYVDLGIASDHGNFHRYSPVEFKADHPFLYFVMDSQMHVALMAGKIIDPLSSRIR